MREKKSFPTRFKPGTNDKRTNWSDYRQSRLSVDALPLCKLNRLFKSYCNRIKTRPVEPDSDEERFFEDVERQIKRIKDCFSGAEHFYTESGSFRKSFYETDVKPFDPKDGDLWVELPEASTGYGSSAYMIANNRAFEQDFGTRDGVDCGSAVYVRIQSATLDLAEAVEALTDRNGAYDYAGDLLWEVEQEQQEEALDGGVLSDFKTGVLENLGITEDDLEDLRGLEQSDELTEEDKVKLKIAALLDEWNDSQWKEYFYELFQRADANWEEQDASCWHVDRFDKMTESSEVSDFTFDDEQPPPETQIPLFQIGA